MKNDPRLVALRAELDIHKQTCARIDAAAAAESRGLTAAETAQYDGALTRMNAIGDESEAITSRSDGLAAIASVNAGLFGDDSASSSSGETLALMGRAALGGVGNRKYAADVETLTRVVAHGVAADGTAPVTIEGDLVKFVDSNRYAVNAARRIPMPDNHAPTFKRPRLTQRTTVGTQAAEGDVLSSQRIQTTGDTVTKVTKGGVLSLSEQEIDWTDPAMLGLAIEDLAESYAIDTDDFFTTAIESSVTTNKTICSLTATPDVFQVAVATAAAAVYGASKKIPDTLFVSVDRWAYILGLTDDDKRPLFGTGQQLNAPGSSNGVTSFEGLSVAGLKVVVDPNFSANTWIVAASQLVEFYEQNKGLLTVAAPSTLEVQYAYRGYVAAQVYAAGTNGLEAS